MQMLPNSMNSRLDQKGVPLRALSSSSVIHLFAGGEEGVLYDLMSPARLFSDTGGTVPAVVGDPVAFVKSSVPGDLDATQATTSQRPVYYVAANGDRVLQNDEIDDALSVTLPNMGTACTVAYVTQSEVRLEEGLTLNGAYTLPQIDLLGFMAIDRALTTLEKVQLIRHLASLATGVVYGVDIDAMTLACLNAVDVFVYDTTKDSDGGAWATSYPAQMLVVGNAANAKIYDATDPDLTLHTTLDFTGYTITSVDAVEGVLSVGTTTGLAVFNLADGDTTVALDYTTATSPAIVNNTVNAVAMTVLDDAPIDPATGLQVPTIAVATDGGVSVITDGGDVWDITSANASYTHSKNVQFDTAGALFLDLGSTNSSSYQQNYVFRSLPTADTVLTLNSKVGTGADADENYTSRPSVASDLRLVNDGTNNRAINIVPVGDDIAIAMESSSGLNIVAPNTTTPANGMVAYITSDYNTGWMHGDIKGAWLSSTDDTDLVGGELVTNGDFATDTDWTKGTGWTISGGTATHAAGVGSDLEQAGAVIAGKLYVMSIDVVAVRATSTLYVVAGVTNTYQVIETLAATGTKLATFIAPANGKLAIRLGGLADVDIDNISVRLADQDRSVNNNGLPITGTATREPVATGAELVWYTFGSACTVTLGSDITSTGSLLWWEKIGGVAVQHCKNYDGSDSFVDGVVGTPPTTGIEIVGTTLTFKAGATLALARPHGNPIADPKYADELPLFQENAACTLYGASDAVTALAHDVDTDLLHVGASAGRSVFRGLERITNTTTSVSKAISASGGLIGEK